MAGHEVLAHGSRPADPSAPIAVLSETDLIERVRARLPPPPDWLIVGIGDDAAVVEPPRKRLEVLSVDALVEGVHFETRFTPPDAIGHRALAVNLSDLAAMGAEPRLALLSLALPPTFSCSDFDRLIDGLTALASRYRVQVVGGNLTRSPGPLVVNVTVAGTVKRRQALTRGGARPGDELYVTGHLGAAGAGLQMLRQSRSSVPAQPDSCVKRYLYPEPRIRVGLLLGRNRAATACMDLSDGLADGVRQIAGASGVGAILDAGSLPIDSDARAWFGASGIDPVEAALTLGDDYELVCAVRPRSRGRLQPAARLGGVPLTRVGVCTGDAHLLVRYPGSIARPLPRGFSHFG